MAWDGKEHRRVDTVDNGRLDHLEHIVENQQVLIQKNTVVIAEIGTRLEYIEKSQDKNCLLVQNISNKIDSLKEDIAKGRVLVFLGIIIFTSFVNWLFSSFLNK